ncbi:uncharacterized protein LOC120336204 isoform X1 [Styela clava]
MASDHSDMEEGEVVEVKEETDLRQKLLKRERFDAEEEEDEEGLSIKPPPVPTKKHKHRHKNKEEKKKKHRKKRSRSREKKNEQKSRVTVLKPDDRTDRNKYPEKYDDYRGGKDERRRNDDNRNYDRGRGNTNRQPRIHERREEFGSRGDARGDRDNYYHPLRREDDDRISGGDRYSSQYRGKDHGRYQTTGGVDFHTRPGSQISRRGGESSSAQHRREEVRGGRRDRPPPPLLVRRYDDEDDRSKNEPGKYSKPSSTVSSSSERSKISIRDQDRKRRDESRNKSPTKSHRRAQTSTGVRVENNMNDEVLSINSSDEDISENQKDEESDKDVTEEMADQSPAGSGSGEDVEASSGSEGSDEEEQDLSGEESGSGEEEVPGSSEEEDAESGNESPLEPLRSKFDSPEPDQEGSESDDDGQEEGEDESAASDSDQQMEESPVPSPEILKPELPYYLPAIQGCRSVDEFQCLNRIEEGTYGVVYRAKDKKTGEVVALKRLKMEKEREGFPITSLREVCTLLKAHHPNIVTVQEIVVGSNMDKIYIVMDYVEHDLKSLMETMKQPFLVGEVKTLMIQLLRGVHHLHDNWILHRDLKTSNLLLSHRGILKIGDFGLAREYGSPLKPYTPIVVTLWYRSPELLLGCKEYSTYIDIWSVGCIFAELLTMKPLFPGKSEIMQLNLIFKELGTPSEKIWPGYDELPMVRKATFVNYPYNQLRKRFGTSITEKGFKLLNRFLTYCPSKRITAQGALKHDWFHETPQPVDPAMFPTWPAKSEQPRVKKVVDSPKAPQGGKEYNSLINDEEGLVTGFQLTAPKHGISKHGVGFNLKF